LVEQRYEPFQFLAHFTSICEGKFTKAPEKCLLFTHRGVTLGALLHALGMFLDYLGDFLCIFSNETLFSKPFFVSIFCIFNSSKHAPIAKKWQKRRGRILTTCNYAKSGGTVVSTMACFIT